METATEVEYADPSYNGDVVEELDELATALEQYWRERRTRYAGQLAHDTAGAEDSDAVREWQNFCNRGVRFLDRYLKAPMPSLNIPLRQLWEGHTNVAREALKTFEKEAVAELWMPFSLNPLKFAYIRANNPV